MTDSDLIVFVVDDDEDIRSSLSRGLGKRGFAVEAFGSAQDFLDAYDGARAGCLVLDYGMPGMNGLELQAHLNTREFPLSVIFVTGHGGVPESVQAMKGGAIDFLEKPFRQAILIERIEAGFAAATARLDSLREVRETRERFDRLTAREQEIVDHMIANPAEVSSKEIANRLGISPRTVDHHRARILEKLEVRNLVELRHLATWLDREKH